MADNLHSAYDEILESIECPVCHTTGMLPDGGIDYICPECGYEGSLEDENDDEYGDEDE